MFRALSMQANAQRNLCYVTRVAVKRLRTKVVDDDGKILG